jgi:HEAT repeat protein
MILMRNVHKYLRRVPISQRRLFCKKVLHSELTSSSIQAKIWEGAVPTLGDEKSEAMIPELSRALAHPDKDVRFEATTQLGRTYSPLAVPAFLEALKDD